MISQPLTTHTTVPVIPALLALVVPVLAQRRLHLASLTVYIALMRCSLACVIGFGMLWGCRDEIKQKPQRPELTEAGAIDLVHAYLAKQTVPREAEEKRCRDEVATTRVRCQQWDRDVGRPCGAPEPGAPDGYRTITTPKTVCKQEKVQKPGPCATPPRGGTWKATHLDDAHQWRVEVVESSMGKSAWTVMDESKLVVSVQPPC